MATTKVKTTPEWKRNGQRIDDTARCPISFRGDSASTVPTERVCRILDDATIQQLGIRWTEGPLWLEDDDDDADDGGGSVEDIADGSNTNDDTNDNGNNDRNRNHPSQPKRGYLFFTDPTIAKIFRYDPRSDEVVVWAIHCGGIDPNSHLHSHSQPESAEPGSNGMASFGPTIDSMVVICQHAAHAIVECQLGRHVPGRPLHEAPGYRVLCDAYRGRPFHSPNDVIIHRHVAAVGDGGGDNCNCNSDGDGDGDGNQQDSEVCIYFTDPIYGLLQKSDRWCDEWRQNRSYLEQRSSQERTGFKGVYRYHHRSGAIDLVTKFHRRPNGLAIAHSNDSTKTCSLWVADSTIGNPSWTEYELQMQLRSRQPMNMADDGDDDHDSNSNTNDATNNSQKNDTNHNTNNSSSTHHQQPQQPQAAAAVRVLNSATLVAIAHSDDSTKASSLWVADSTIGNPSWTEYELELELQSQLQLQLQLQSPQPTDTAADDVDDDHDSNHNTNDATNTNNNSSTHHHHQPQQAQPQQQPPPAAAAVRVLNSATLGYVFGSIKGDGTDLLGHEGLSDGFKIDGRGRIWSSIPNGYCVIENLSKASRRVVCEVLLGVNTSNIAFGYHDDDDNGVNVWLTGSFGLAKIMAMASS
eukprot:CAMPEP_0119571986 /NCGR_PEP_ID=MMETSP1352-20130426/44395_1 /TAXON_ID=265584 /ORGANISM="Stauroneis constricta, Strain CCMP1120" /LENGTH=635 /DNA_ID=CAMNT_0007621669 /DNA_START=871 /DNA_END=2778 /DNA_ORIENTATION=-